MAVELEHFLTDQLAQLPANHPDRPSLAAQKALVDAFLDRPGAATAEESLIPASAEPRPLAAPADLYVAGESADATGPAADSAEPVASTALSQAEQAERERVVLKGRLGKRVRYSTTPRGVRRAEFNLATAVDEETTAWHTVLAFRERAERLEAANPQKGQYLEVIGYRDVVDRTDAHGKSKQVERIIAAHIRLR